MGVYGLILGTLTWEKYSLICLRIASVTTNPRKYMCTITTNLKLALSIINFGDTVSLAGKWVGIIIKEL